MATCFCKQPCERHMVSSYTWKADQKKHWEEFVRKGYVEFNERYKNKDFDKYLEAYRMSK